MFTTKKIKRIIVLAVYLITFAYIVAIAKLPFSYLVPAFGILIILTILVYIKSITENLANYYYVSGNVEKARKLFQSLISKGSKNTLIYLNYSIILVSEGRAKEALSLLQKAQTMERHILTDKNIILTIGSCYWVMGEIKKAIETLEGLQKNYEYVNSHVLTTLGYLYFLDGNNEKALELTKLSLEDTPDFASSWDNIGQISYSEGKLSDAKEAFEKAVSYNPNLIESHYYLGLIALDENLIEDAIENLETAMECSVSALNSVTKEQVQAKLDELKK